MLRRVHNAGEALVVGIEFLDGLFSIFLAVARGARKEMGGKELEAVVIDLYDPVDAVAPRDPATIGVEP